MLDDELLALCAGRRFDEGPTPDEIENAYHCLVDELLRLMPAQEMFTFLLEAGVGGSSKAERELRPTTLARRTGRTSKTLRGARRQKILHRVLESLRKQPSQFTLSTVVAEVLRWSPVRQELLRRAGSISAPNVTEQVRSRYHRLAGGGIRSANR